MPKDKVVAAQPEDEPAKLVRLKEVGTETEPGLGRVEEFEPEHAEALLAAQASGQYPVCWAKADDKETDLAPIA